VRQQQGARSSGWRCGVRGLLWLLCSLSARPLLADAPAGDRHLGVATCAGSTCHGATRPFAGSAIRQDEYFIWQRQDPHAGALRSLQTPEADAISRRLGMGPAASAENCLSCHAENVPAALRGERFVADDGIGCESCHGASERWIGPHVKGYRTDDERVAAGLHATWKPAVRAELCASCHVGDADHRIDHRTMAAGHPPLLFELDTFTALEPPHWDVDDDYRARKGDADGARDWAVGQAAAARRVLAKLMRTPVAGGLMPELSLFDCNACHHGTRAGRANAERNGGMPVGTPPLADTPLVMLQPWLDLIDPAMAAEWRRHWTALHAAASDSREALQREADAMTRLIDRRIVPLAERSRLSPLQLRQLVAAIVTAAGDRHRGDFSHAEHTAMAVSVLATAWSERQRTPAPTALKPALDAVYREVQDRDRFSPARWTDSLKAVISALGG